MQKFGFFISSDITRHRCTWQIPSHSFHVSLRKWLYPRNDVLSCIKEIQAHKLRFHIPFTMDITKVGIIFAALHENVICYEGGQNTSARSIWGHSPLVFSRNFEFDLFHCVKMAPKFEEKQFQRWAGYISISNFRPFLPCVLTKTLEPPNLTCFTKSKWRHYGENEQTVTKMQSVMKVGKYINMPNLRPILLCVHKEIPRNRQHDLFY